MKNFIAFFLFTSMIISAQVFKISGVVKDSSNNNPLSFASIRISGTLYGTSTNLDGEFSLKLKRGTHTLIFSYIGYKTDSISINLSNNMQVDLTLSPIAIVLPEVVVNDEDPAYRIIREAIKRKEINRKGLSNFEYDAYSKKIIKSVGEVALIEETFVKGYNKVGEWEKEFLKSVFKTENLKKESRTMDFNITEKYFVDFSLDTLSLALSLVYLPLANEAFSYYDYKLEKTILGEEIEYYEIKVIPKSKIQPLLKGTILIDSEDYALNNVKLTTNEGVRFPYINNLKVDFSQTLSKNENYWLPLYVEYSASMDVNIQGLIKIGTMEFNQLSNITNYKINDPIPDSIANAQRSKYGSYTVDTTENQKKPLALTREEIDSVREIPLTKKELEAFETLDSTMTMDKMVKVEGALSGLISTGDSEDSTDGFIYNTLEYTSKFVEFRNNRVLGLLFGLKYNDDLIKDKFLVNSSFGYSFGRKKYEVNLDIEYVIDDFLINNIYGSYFNRTKSWQNFSPYPDFINSIGITLGLNDQFNYYLSKGAAIGIGKNITKNISAKIGYVTESQKSLKSENYKTLFNKNRYVRENPIIANGRDNKLSLSTTWGKDPLEIQVMPENGLIAILDYSSPNFQSDFDYRKIRIIGMIKSETFFNELFISPYLHIIIDIASVNGDYGPQHMITPNSALSFYSPLGSFKGIKPYQFVGTEMAGLHLEHNWRSLPFQSLGLDFLTDLHLDIITGIGGFKINNNSNHLKQPSINKNEYWEAYVSISRILAFSRVDFSYNSLQDFNITASIGILL